VDSHSSGPWNLRLERVTLAGAMARKVLRAVARWAYRLFALAAMLLFAALVVIFVIVTVNEFGNQDSVTERVPGLPPIYLITAILIPACLAFVAGFWLLFMDSFNEGPAQAPPIEPVAAPLKRPFLARFRLWRRAG
jgi:TRAP-type C4-dicarboxylate transport system permease small subunit